MVLLYYLHYILLSSGFSSVWVLLGVFIKNYSDASQAEIGLLYMVFPFVSLFVKPYFCYLADRYVAHRSFLIISIGIVTVSYAPFCIIPFFPAFNQAHQRLSWWIMAAGCTLGSAALGLVWSIGDTLANNAAAKNNSSFSHMRLSGTISWGVYGYIIGQINDTPYLPKYVPSFLILVVSNLIEMVLMLCWNKEAFVLGDSESPEDCRNQLNRRPENDQLSGLSTPIAVSHAGSLRINKQASIALRGILSNDDLIGKLNSLSETKRDQPERSIKSPSLVQKTFVNPSDTEANQDAKQGEQQTANLQVVLFKMIMKNDGRLIKYLILYIIFGLIAAPVNFLFMSFEDVCMKENYNFSNLAGAVIISQAVLETVGFFVMPYTKNILNRISIVSICLVIFIARSVYYAFFYYDSGNSLYWALVAEWSHGFGFAMYTSLMCDLALMFANQSSFFIPQLRQLGILSDPNVVGPAKSFAEEQSIKIALRATMQAAFGGALDGLGSGLGNLGSGIIYDSLGYVRLWQVTAAVCVATFIIHLAVEFSRSHFSDLRYPSKLSPAKTTPTHA